MERLTGRREDLSAYIKGLPEFEAPKQCVKLMQQAIDRLAHYEDLEEQGRLVELPCRIDEPIFLIRAEKGPRKKMKFWVDEYEIDHFTIGGTMIPMITACSKENEWEELVEGTQKGYEYFLTRPEAEAALAASGKEG